MAELKVSDIKKLYEALAEKHKVAREKFGRP